MQCTIAAPVEIHGAGLFMGEPVTVRLLPAPEDHGLRFARVDLPGKPQVRAIPENVPAAQRWTGLKDGPAEVRMIEHFLAVFCCLGVSNVLVETTAAEMPVLDGAAEKLARLVLNAGVQPQKTPRRVIKLDRPLAVCDKEVALVAAPGDGLTVTYVLDYGRRFMGSQVFTTQITQEIFLRELAPARTYVLRPEVDAFIKMGLGKGATPENTLILEEDGRYSVPPRFPDECARHKVLDILGDLYLVGAALDARVLGYKSGHATNVRLARALSDRQA